MAINITSLPFALQTTQQLPPTQIFTVLAGTYTFALTDAQFYVRFNSASAQTATIPPNTFLIGTQLTAEQAGAGALSVVAGSGVTINPASPIFAASQFAIIGFIQVASNVWTAFGNRV